MKQKKPMLYKILSISLLLGIGMILLPLCSNSQNKPVKELLEKTDLSLKNIQNVAYKIRKTEKSFTSRDTVSNTAICSLYIEPKDKIGMLYTIDATLPEQNSLWHEVYDGNQAFYAKINKDSEKYLNKFNFYTVKTKDDIIGSYSSNFLCSNFFDRSQVFTKKTDLNEVKISEEIHKNTPVYVLTVIGDDYGDSDDHISNAIDKYYIRKSDYLPIAYSFYGEFQGMKQYEFVDIEYISINSAVTPNDFKVYSEADEVDAKNLYENNKGLILNEAYSEIPHVKNSKSKEQKAKYEKVPYESLALNNGKNLKLSDLQGKVVLLDFWYRGCLPCLKATPELIQLQEKYKDDLVVIGINDADDKDQVTDYYTYKKVPYFSSYSTDLHIARELNINAFPTFIILNKNGELADKIEGFKKNKIEHTIRELISEQ